MYMFYPIQKKVRVVQPRNHKSFSQKCSHVLALITLGQMSPQHPLRANLHIYTTNLNISLHQTFDTIHKVVSLFGLSVLRLIYNFVSNIH